MEKIRLLLVDDQTHFINSLENVITNRTDDIEIVGIAENGIKALQLVEELNPSIILMDVRMPMMDGVECTKIVVRNHPEIKIMIFTTFDDDEYIFKAIEFGAVGYILKNMLPNELITSIRAVHEGIFQMSPSIVKKLAERHNQDIAQNTFTSQESMPPWMTQLRIREREVLLLLCQGYSNKEIGERLFIAEQTVKNYTSHIYEVMGVENRFAAQRMGLEAGIITY